MPAGYYNTDLGNSLADFQREHLGTIDSRTTFIIVGDGRNNYNDPRLDIFNLLPVAAGARSGSTRKRRGCGAAATATC